MQSNSRHPAIIIVLIVITLMSGLASRYFDGLPTWFSSHAGDALWAMLVYWLWTLILPRQAVWKIALIALSSAFLVEFSQLYQAEWINALRQNTLVALVIGRGFLWIDLLRYSVGIACAAGLDYWIFRQATDR